MKTIIVEMDTRMFFKETLDKQYSQLFTVMADAVSECRAAADQAAVLNRAGEIGLLRLAEIWCGLNGNPEILFFEGTQVELLANLVAQVYARLLQNLPGGSEGLALLVELQHMMGILMIGEWFE